MKQPIIILIVYLFPVFLLAEGTKQLRPTKESKGHLILYPEYSFFGLYGSTYQASPDEEIKIRINSTDERIYIGLNNFDGAGDNLVYRDDSGSFIPNVPFRVRAPSGAIIYESVIPGTGQTGNIQTYEQAVAGPIQLGNPNGYDAIILNTLETGDYVIEFNIDDNTMFSRGGNPPRLNLNFFDVTVADNSETPILGRLHSKGWQITSVGHWDREIFAHPFDGKVYPYDGKNAVYEVDFNGIRPFIFVINFNSTGIRDTGNSEEDRKSRMGFLGFPEFSVFLNPPDPDIFPVEEVEIEMSSDIKIIDCNTRTFCLNYTTNQPGHLSGFIDLNGNGIFDELIGEVRFEHMFDGPGDTCIEWDGKDAFGEPISSSFNILSNFGFGVTHLPIYDVEHHYNGFQVRIVRPEEAEHPLLFWDDSLIEDGFAIDGLLNLQGCNATTTGCHKWSHRGNIQNISNLFERQETINTWWFAQMVYDTLEYIYPETQNIRLSFDPNGPSGKDTLICRDDSLSIFIVSDGDPHFDNTRFQYLWSMNGEELAEDLREQRVKIGGPTEFIVISVDKEQKICDRPDTIRVNVVAPLRIDATIDDENCRLQPGSIMVEILDGPPAPQFSWQDHPEITDRTLTGLWKGIYHLHIADPAFSDGCAIDTFFVLTGEEGIRIDTVITETTPCYLDNGQAVVQMADDSRTYEYLWDNTLTTTIPQRGDLAQGAHHVLVTDTGTGCHDETDFQIDPLPLIIPFEKENELCNDRAGSISMQLPEGAEFHIIWNGVLTNDIRRDALAESTHDLRIENKVYPSCSVDTSLVVDNIMVDVTIEDILTIPTECYLDNGRATVQMNDLALTYEYSWNNGPFIVMDQISSLPQGENHVLVRDVASGCFDEMLFTIPPIPLLLDVIVSDELCKNGDGTIELVLPSGADLNIYWNGGLNSSTSMTRLSEGRFQIEAVDKRYNTCRFDTIVDLINANIEIEILQLVIDPSDCSRPTGSAEVMLPPASTPYSISWNGGPRIGLTSIDGLAVGDHTLNIEIAGPACVKDTSFTIPGEGFSYDVSLDHTICTADNGNIGIAPQGPDLEIVWENGSRSFSRGGLSTGAYSFVLINTKDLLNCTIDSTVFIEQEAYEIETDFNYEIYFDDDQNSGRRVLFTNLTSNIILSLWDFGDGNSSQIKHPEHAYDQSGDYMITLEVRDRYGCTGIAVKPLKIARRVHCDIALPNAFSPNGDMVNDDIGILGSAEKVELIIFNRWGEAIFRTQQLDKRWDGTYRGQESPVGAYPYMLNYECITETGQLEKHRIIGDITLIR